MPTLTRFSSFKEAKEASENLGYYNGDHWKTWIGPRIPDGEQGAAELMAEVERVFQSLNLIKECCDRHVNSLIGDFPHWYLKDSKGDRVDASEAEVQLQRWIDATLERSDSGVTSEGDPFWRAVLDLTVTGEGALRLWQPRRFENEEDAIDRIYLHAPKNGSVIEERDLDDDFRESLTYNYGQKQAEKEYFDESGNLVIETGEGESITLDTGGRWTISLLRSPALLSPQIKKNQDAINHALTMMMRNQEQGGFLERIFLNAQLPGEWVEDSKAPGGQRFEPNAAGLETGPGQDTFLYGIPTGDPANPTYTNPSVFVREPANPQTFLQAIAAYREFVYHAFGQGHMIASSDGAISGVSRIQLRADFELMLKRQKRVIQAAIANIFNVVLRLLGYTELTAVVELRISTGKLSPEERQQVVAEFQAGLLSKTTAIAMLGSVEDVDAELALIAEERKGEMASPKVKGDGSDEVL